MPTKEIAVKTNKTEYSLQPEKNYKRIIEAFLSDQDVNANSKKTYRYGITAYFNWMANNGKTLDVIQECDILEYKQALINECSKATGKTLTPMTVNAYITTLRLFYQWAARKGYARDLAYHLKGVPSESGFIKMHLTPDQCRELLRTTKESESKTATRDYAILKLLLGTGIREVEAIRARICDMTVRNGVPILWVQRKGRAAKDKFVPLSEDVVSAINDYLSERKITSNEEPLFTTNGYSSKHQGKPLSPRSIQLITKTCLRRIGLDSHEYSGHSLRHTTAVTIIRGGAGLYQAQLALGHSSPATTQRYLKSIENDEILKNPPTRLVAQMLGENK